MTTIVTAAGDSLDELVSLHYGPDVLSTALAAVLAANIGLAQVADDLPPGTRIVLPGQDAVTRQRPALW